MPLALSLVSLASLAEERRDHFARLGEAPELHLELMLATASAYRVGWNGRSVGYALRGADGRLVELELERLPGHETSEVFESLVERLDLEGAWCFSFDARLLALGAERDWSSTVDGTLFRDLADVRGPHPNEHAGRRLRPATIADLETIVPFREGVFDDEEQCREWILRDRVTVLESDGDFIGIGLLTRVWATRREHDVGVMVHPDHRRHGHAAYILRALKRRCLDEGMRPTAGCAPSNVASSRALGRAGFVGTHALVRIERSDRIRNVARCSGDTT